MVGNLIEENLVEKFADYLGNSDLFIYFVQIINNLFSLIKSRFFPYTNRCEFQMIYKDNDE